MILTYFQIVIDFKEKIPYNEKRKAVGSIFYDSLKRTRGVFLKK